MCMGDGARVRTAVCVCVCDLPAKSAQRCAHRHLVEGDGLGASCNSLLGQRGDSTQVVRLGRAGSGGQALGGDVREWLGRAVHRVGRRVATAAG